MSIDIKHLAQKVGIFHQWNVKVNLWAAASSEEQGNHNAHHMELFWLKLNNLHKVPDTIWDNLIIKINMSSGQWLSGMVRVPAKRWKAPGSISVKGNTPVLFFGVHLSSFPITTCWRGCCFSIVYSCCPCLRFVDYVSEGLFLGSLFCAIDVCVCLGASTILFGCHSLDSMIESREYDSAKFVLLPEIALAIRGLLRGWVCRQAFRKYIQVWTFQQYWSLQECTFYEGVRRTLHILCSTPKKCVT